MKAWYRSSAARLRAPGHVVVAGHHNDVLRLWERGPEGGKQARKLVETCRGAAGGDVTGDDYPVEFRIVLGEPG